MSDSVIFDQLSFVKRGVDAGVPREHAEWLAQEYTQLLEKNLATKTDVANIQHAIEQLRATTQTDVANIQHAIEQLQHNIEQLRATTQTEIERCKADLTWRLLSSLLVFAGIIIAAIKFL